MTVDRPARLLLDIRKSPCHVSVTATPLLAVREKRRRARERRSARRVVEVADVVSILSRYRSGELTRAEARNWARFVETNRTCEFEPGCSVPLRSVVHELANPHVLGPLTLSRAETWIARLRTVRRWAETGSPH